MQRNNSLVHVYSLKNLDAVEALIERVNVYLSFSEKKASQVCLFRAATKLNEGYYKLELKDGKERNRYFSLKKKYDHKYANVFSRFEFSKECILCSLFFLSERLFNTAVSLRFWKKKKY